MKKVIFMVALVAATVSIASAQEFEKGTNVLSLGVGIGSSLGYYPGSSISPGLSVQFEHGSFPVGDVGVISLGGYLGYKGYSYKSIDYKLNYYIIGARSAFHLTSINIDKLDLYGGLMLSYDVASDNFDNDFGYGSTAGLTAYVGGRYYFASKIAGFAELGYGVSYLTLGASFKF